MSKLDWEERQQFIHFDDIGDDCSQVPLSVEVPVMPIENYKCSYAGFC